MKINTIPQIRSAKSSMYILIREHKGKSSGGNLEWLSRKQQQKKPVYEYCC